MKARQAVLLGLMVSFTAILALSSVIPPMDDYFLENPFWNGFSDIESSLRPMSVTSLELLGKAVDPSRSVLLIVGPSEPFPEQEADAVKNFLRVGGTVVLMDDYGTGNDLLAKLELNVRFSGAMLRDPIFKERGSGLPRVLDFGGSSYTADLSSLTLNYATTLTKVDSGAKVLASSTAFSYLDEDGDGQPDEGEAVGPLPVVAEIGYGEGTIFLISDSSLFINSMVDKGDNEAFLKGLVGDKTVYIDRSHWRPGPFTQFKWALTEIYPFISSAEIKYTLLIMVSTLTLRFKWGGRVEEADELGIVLRTHPEWNRNTLIKLKEWRDKLGD